MNAKMVKFGIISKEDYIKRTIAIAQGAYKPREDEPKIWFESLQTMSQVLSNDNQALLQIIIEHEPASLTELEQISHRKKSHLSKTLRTLERYGIVELRKEENRLIPKVKATDFSVEFGLHYGKLGMQ